MMKAMQHTFNCRRLKILVLLLSFLATKKKEANSKFPILFKSCILTLKLKHKLILITKNVMVNATGVVKMSCLLLLLVLGGGGRWLDPAIRVLTDFVQAPGHRHREEEAGGGGDPVHCPGSGHGSQEAENHLYSAKIERIFKLRVISQLLGAPILRWRSGGGQM